MQVFRDAKINGLVVTYLIKNHVDIRIIYKYKYKFSNSSFFKCEYFFFFPQHQVSQNLLFSE